MVDTCGTVCRFTRRCRPEHVFGVVGESHSLTSVVSAILYWYLYFRLASVTKKNRQRVGYEAYYTAAAKNFLFSFARAIHGRVPASYVRLPTMRGRF